MLRKVVSAYPSYIRLSNWWHYKAAPLIGLFYLMVYVNKIDFATSLLVLGASLITIVGIAGFGYFINDLSDIEYDTRVHKVNRASQMSVLQKIFLTIALLAFALFPWLYLPSDLFSWLLIAFQFLLYLVYSFQPFRFKERGVAGVVCDSLYGLTVPAALAVYTYHLIGDRSMKYFPAFFMLLFLLLMVKGFRNILLHQLEDRHNDRRSGIQTLVLNLGGGKSIRLINQIIAPVESFLLIGWVAVVSFSVPFFWISLIAFAVYHFLKIGAWGTLGISRRHLRFKFLYVLNDYYEEWLPLWSLGLLLFFDWRYSVFIAITILFFPNIFISFYAGINKIIMNFKKLREGDYGKWWSSHGHFMYKKDYASNKFVFVACGERKQIDDVHFSLKALSHFSRNEIIVITDATRNEIPIAWKNIVDIKTPAELNSRQASIFLKTSVHKFLPKESRYCCLDANVIALSEEADEIFTHKMGQVTFAPDGKRLNEFSPHAVNCDCLLTPEGHDDQVSNQTSLNRQREFLKKLEGEKAGGLMYLLFLLRFIFSADIFKLDEDTFYNKREKFWFDGKGDPIYHDKEKAGKCDHMRQMIKEKFGVKISDPGWHQWNSGVFLFDESSKTFLDNWHQKTVEIFRDAKWKTHDQGTLIATAWEMGLQKEFLLTKKFNFIADFYNGRLMVKDTEHVSDDGGETLCSPAFINISNFFGVRGWDVWDWVESKLSSVTK